MPDPTAETEAAVEAQQPAPSTSAVSIEAESVGGVAGALGQLLTAGGRAAPRIAVPPPTGRGGHQAAAAQTLLLQQAVGNARTARMLARQELKPGAPAAEHAHRKRPPQSTAPELAEWFAELIHPKHRDLILVVDSARNEVWVFEDAAEPKARKRFGIQRFNQSNDILLPEGVWAYTTASLALEYSLWSDGWRKDVWPNAPHDLVPKSDWPEFDKFLPEEGNRVYAVHPVRGDVLDADAKKPAPKPSSKRAGNWGIHDVQAAHTAIDKPKRPEGADSQAPPPRDLVPWTRNGDWYVNVWLGGDHRALKLDPNESTEDLVRRIKQATADMKGEDDPGRSVRVQGTKAGPPQFHGRHAKGEFTTPPGAPLGAGAKSPYNAPPFPAKIISHGNEGSQGKDGAEITVQGASVDFTMDLDYAAVTEGWWGEFLARWQVIDYTWDIFDVSKVKLSALKGALGKPTEQIQQEIEQIKQSIADEPDEASREAAQAQLEKLKTELEKRGKDPDSGRIADIGRDWANMVEDTEADLDSVPMLIPGVNIAFGALIAVSDVVQLVGAPIKSFFASLAAPMHDNSIEFPSHGTFLLRCFAEPVLTQNQIDRIREKGMEPIFRPPSVAYFAVRVEAINERASEVNDAEALAIESLRKLIDVTADENARADYEAQLKEARAALADNNLEAIERAKRASQAEIDNIKKWRALQEQDVPLDKVDPGLRKWRAMLDLRGVGLDDWGKAQQEAIKRLDEAYKRVSTYGLENHKGSILRPRMTLVSEVDGHVYPIVANLVQEGGSTDRDRRWRLIDVSDENTKRIYKGAGKTHNEAINATFKDFKERCAYGRGTIAIRLPPDQLEKETDGERITVPTQMRAQPGFGERFEQRLQDLATAAEVASLFVAGPIGAGIGMVGGAISAGLAIKNFITRVGSGKPVLSFETAMDALAVVGAVAMMGQAAQKSAKLAALARRARWVGEALHVISTGGQVLVIPASLYMELAAISEEENKELQAYGGERSRVDHGKYQARRLEVWARAVKSGVVMIRMAQMASDPEAGWDPLRKKGGAVAGKPPGLEGKPADELPPALKQGGGTGPPAGDHAPPAGGEHGPPTSGDHAPPSSLQHATALVPDDPFHAAEAKGTVALGTGEAIIRAAGDWKLRVRRMVDRFDPANRADAARELGATRDQALDREYAKADATHGCVPFDVGTIGFDSDVDATMVPKETLSDYRGPRRPISEQINAAADAAQQVVTGLRQRFGGDPDTVLDVAIHAYVGEDLKPQYKSPAEEAAARAHDTAVSWAEARRGMTREEWKALEEQYQTRLGGKDALPFERKMLDQIKQQMIEGLQFKTRMDDLLSESVAKIVGDAKGPLTGEQASTLARDKILLDKRRQLGEAFKNYPDVDWVAVKRLQSEIRWSAPGAYATEAAFAHAVRYGQVRKEAGKARAKARGGGPPTREEVLAELNPNLDEEKWVSPAERSAKLANAANANIGELGRHPHGADPKARAKDTAKYAGRVLEAAEGMGGPVRHGAMEDALRLFKESKWPDGTPELRDLAVARWAEQALDGKGVVRQPDGTYKIDDDTYTAFATAAEAWMRRTALEARITERAMADRTDVPERPQPKPPVPPSTPAVDAIGLSEAAKTGVLAAMPPDTAVAVAGWLPKQRLERISSDPSRIQQLLDAHQRVAPFLTDPLAVAGLRRLAETDPSLPGSQTALKDESMLNAIISANPDSLGLALRVFGRPDMQGPGLHPQRSKVALPELSRDTMRLTVIDRFGVEAWSELRRNDSVYGELDRRIEGLADPAARAALIEEILSADSTVRRKRLLGLPGPKRRGKTSLEVKPDRNDPDWKSYEDDARAFIADPDHANKVNPRTGKPYSEMTPQELDRFLEARATLLQVRDRFVDPSRYKEFQKLSQKQKLKILDDMDALAETHGVLSQWNDRDRVAEALYVPGGGFNQKTFPNPAFPTKTGRVGGSRLDGVYKPGERDALNQNTQHIEFKSNKKVTVGLATEHAEEGWQDWHALLWDKARKDDGLVIWYAREPAPAIRQQVIDVLLGPTSVFTAVRFGDGTWIERPPGVPMRAPKALPPWWTGPPPGGPATPPVPAAATPSASGAGTP